MKIYKEYTNEDIIKFAAEVNSLAGLLRKLNLKCAGGNYANMKRKLQQLDVDCSHWKGQSWSKGERLKDWSNYTKANSLKPHLINKRGHRCEKCKNETWLGFPVPLEVEHIDGDKTNNREKNLLLLCCNCHALTSTWRGRNKKDHRKFYKFDHKKHFCKKCNREITRSSKTGLCSKCINFRNRKIQDRPSKEQLLEEIKNTNYCEVGRKYGVSDNAIRKWLK